MKTFKKLSLNALFILALGLYMASFSSCKTGEGCPGANVVGGEIENYDGKRGKSGLYSKKEKKRMGK